jgi:hypothetical protein
LPALKAELFFLDAVIMRLRLGGHGSGKFD